MYGAPTTAQATAFQPHRPVAPQIRFLSDRFVLVRGLSDRFPFARWLPNRFLLVRWLFGDPIAPAPPKSATVARLALTSYNAA